MFWSYESAFDMTALFYCLDLPRLLILSLPNTSYLHLPIWHFSLLTPCYVSCLIEDNTDVHLHPGIKVWGLWFISDFNLKPPQQIFPIDNNVNLPYETNFLYHFFCDYDLKMSKTVGDECFPTYTTLFCITSIIYYFRIQTTMASYRGVLGIIISNLEGTNPQSWKGAILYTPSCHLISTLVVILFISREFPWHHY